MWKLSELSNTMSDTDKDTDADTDIYTYTDTDTDADTDIYTYVDIYTNTHIQTQTQTYIQTQPYRQTQTQTQTQKKEYPMEKGKSATCHGTDLRASMSCGPRMMTRLAVKKEAKLAVYEATMMRAKKRCEICIIFKGHVTYCNQDAVVRHSEMKCQLTQTTC